MPLRKPGRLPKHLNRPASPFIRSMTRKYYRKTVARKRQRMFAHTGRHWSKILKIVGMEIRVWAGIAVVLTLLTTIAILLFSPVFDVKQIQIRRQDARVDIEEVEQVLSPLFSTRLPFVTKSQVLTLLEVPYPDIRQIDVSKRYPSTLVVTISLDPVIAELKLDAPLIQSGSGAVTGSGSYAYITSAGYAVFSPIALSEDPLPSIRLTDWGIAPTNRTFLLSPDFLKTAFAAQDMLRVNFGFNVSETLVFLRAREFHIRANSVWLWFDLSSPLPLQFQRFRDFLKTVPLNQVKEYVDLRISDRVMYK